MAENINNPRPVTDVAAASAPEALEHFERLLAVETDCADIHVALRDAHPGFVVLDVRSPEAYAKGHVPGSINVPYRQIRDENLEQFPQDVLFVVYCAGPHCNAADHAGVRLARLGRRVKKMIGGLSGWADEGFRLDADR